MAQYIDKSTVVAEINRVVNSYDPTNEITSGRYALVRLRNFIETLEVKEVDLEKEFSQWWKGEKAKDYNVDILYERYSNVSMKLAKHFFELGMRVSNPLTVKDIKKIYHLVNEVSDDLGVRAMYVNIYQEALKRFKAQKGE